MTPLQARLHNEVCLPSGLPACLCGSYARVAEKEIERLREALSRLIGFVAAVHAMGPAVTEHMFDLGHEIDRAQAALSAGAGEK